MLIRAKTSLEFDDSNGYWSELKQVVKFKYKNRIFRVKLTKTLTSTQWIKENGMYRNQEEFLRDCLSVIKNRGYQERNAKNIVTSYIKSKLKQTNEDILVTEIKEILSSNSTDFEIEIEYKE